MKINLIKFIAIAAVAVPMILVGMFRTEPVRVFASTPQEDAAAIYKKQCALCHKANAEKFFNTELTDEAMVESIMKGKKGEKPPNMPAFGEKGITAEQAKVLVGHMRQLRAAAPATE